VKKKALPWPGRLSTQMTPPCASTASLQKVRPSPVDILRPALRFSTWPNFSNMRSNASGGMPSPVSRTLNSRALSLAWAEAVTVPPAGVNLMAFPSRLTSVRRRVVS